MSDEPIRLHQSVYARVNRAGEVVFARGERAVMEGFARALPPGTRLIITLETQLPLRSLDQTKYYFGAIVRKIGGEVGNTEREQHDLLVEMLLPPRELRPWDTSSLPNDFDRMSEFIDACIIFAAEMHGLEIDEPRRQPG